MTTAVAGNSSPHLIQKCTAPVIRGVQQIVDGANSVKNDTEALTTAFRIVNYFCMGLQLVFKNVKPIASTIFHFSGSIAIMEFFGDTIGTAYYLVSGAFLKDIQDKRYCGFLGGITLGAAGVSGAVLWLSQLGFYSLGAVAAGIGGIGLAPIICGVVAVGYTFLAGDAIQSIARAENHQQKVKAWIDLASRVANIALFVVITTSLIVPMAPVVTVPMIVTLGLIATGLGLTSFLYKHYNKAAF